MLAKIAQKPVLFLLAAFRHRCIETRLALNEFGQTSGDAIVDGTPGLLDRIARDSQCARELLIGFTSERGNQEPLFAVAEAAVWRLVIEKTADPGAGPAESYLTVEADQGRLTDHLVRIFLGRIHPAAFHRIKQRAAAFEHASKSLSAMRLRADDLLPQKPAMLLHECQDHLVVGFGARGILRTNAAFPCEQIQSASGIGVPEGAIGQQRRIAARDAPGQFGTDPEKWRRLHLAYEIVVHEDAHPDSKNSAARALHFFKENCGFGLVIEQTQPGRG